MKTCIRVALAVLCVIASCNAGEQCSCQPEEILETISEVLDYRDALAFTYKFRHSVLDASPTASSHWRHPVRHQHTVPRKTDFSKRFVGWILYLDAIKGREVDNKKLVDVDNEHLNLVQIRHHPSQQMISQAIGTLFSVLFVDSKCLIFRIFSYTVGGRTGCAWWVKESARDNRLWHCRLIFDFFCGVSYQEIYKKEACDHMTKKTKISNRLLGKL
uniref:Putative lipocalin-7 4 n=1 Tax=Ixodes ricinus TaxID=34613 RepID=V5GP80_IXORI